MVEEYTYAVIRGSSVVLTAKNPYGGTTTYTYEDDSDDVNYGMLTSRTDPAFGDFGGTSGKQFQVDYHYDSNYRGRLTKEIRTIGASPTVVTDYDYDGYGRMTQQIADSNGLRLTTQYTYNAFNEMTKSVDPRGVVRVMKYDHVGRLTQQYTLANLSLEGAETGNALEETQYTFNSNGHPELVKVADDQGSFTPGSPDAWLETEYEYDIYGRRTKMIVGGTDETSYEYDNQNRIVKTTTPGGVWTKIERDGRGLQTKQILGYGTTEVLTTTYEYDGNGNLTKVTEPSGRHTTYLYDDFDRRTKATVGGGS